MQYLQYKDTILPGVSTILISLIVTLVLWYDIFLSGNTASGESIILGDSPLAHLLNGYVPFDGLACRIGALICLVITAYCMISLNDSFAFINVRTVLPALIFSISTSLLMRPHGFTTAWIITLCVVLYVNSSFKLVEGNPEKYIKRAFDVGLVLSIVTLFATQTIVLTIPFLILLYRCHNLNIRLFFAFLTGIALPYFYCILIVFALGDIDAWTNYWSQWFNYDGTLLDGDGYEKLIYIGIIATLFLISFSHFLRIRSSQNVRSREEVVFLIACFFATIVIMLMNPSNAPLILPTCLFFCGYIIGQYFSLEWSLLSKILMAIFAVSSLLFFIQPNLI